jgi:hypothetical protein
VWPCVGGTGPPEASAAAGAASAKPNDATTPIHFIAILLERAAVSPYTFESAGSFPAIAQCYT